MPIDIKFINELWVPDIYIYFLKHIKELELFTKFAGNLYLMYHFKYVFLSLYRSVYCEWKRNFVQSRNADNILVPDEIPELPIGQSPLQVQAWKLCL